LQRHTIAHNLCALKEALNMHIPYNSDAPKKPTNLTVNSDLLKQAKALNLNLSSTLESALVEKIKESQREAWKRENKEAIEVYNKRVDERGTFGDSVKNF
jgi:antitoxin CcdA